jgi:hypothetical protein
MSLAKVSMWLLADARGQIPAYTTLNGDADAIGLERAARHTELERLVFDDFLCEIYLVSFNALGRLQMLMDVSAQMGC